MTERILVVDDDAGVRTSVADALRGDRRTISVAESAEHALSRIAVTRPDLVITDVRMPGLSGVELLQQLRELLPDVDVLLMTAFDDMPTIVSAMRAGARDFLVKPLDLHRMRALVRRVFDDRRDRREKRDTTETPVERLVLDQLVGRTPGMIEVFKTIGQAAGTRATILVRGDSGTGKELVARAVHVNSAVGNAPFVAVNCAALPTTLLESELFGHVKGAFTGAHGARKGRFEMAGRGTIFLDEIGDTSLEFQSKLLRVLQEREFYPVGGEQPVRSEARVIAATHRDLEALVRAGRFREDVYFRLRVVEIVLPPLRERVGDIPALVAHLVQRAADSLECPMPKVSDEALLLLQQHPWPGNVRELEHALTRAVVASTRGGVMRPEHITLSAVAVDGSERPVVLRPLDDVEREHVARILESTGGHKARAAEILGVSRPRLNRLMEKYDLQ
ncbi:MAG TPA: sigma-54 dependent transcriptional regulator [Gemmatimonas sp.]|nr:sigma-54 dependent transcriptional regulator [Gemmatimonas sp.]